MKLATINKLCCPFDRADLDLTIIEQTTDGHVLEGFLYCQVCKRIYPIVKGIPIMNPDDYREFKLELPLYKKWQKHLKGKEIQPQIARALEQLEKEPPALH